MTKAELYAVTGVSGRTGAATAQALITAGKQVRVVVRDATKGAYWQQQGAEVAVADLSNAAMLTNALSGVTAAYIVSPPQYSQPDLFAQAEVMANVIADAAVAAKLPKLVALSSVGAEQASDTGWIGMNRTLEQRLSQTDLNLAFLRAAYFMENWQPLIASARAQGELASFLAPLERKIPMIATQDIGEIAAQVLCENWQGTRAINLTGPADYSPHDVAHHLAAQLDKPIAAVAIPESHWQQAMAGQGFSPAALAGFIEMTKGLNSGHIAFNKNDSIEHRSGSITIETLLKQVTE
ncbi:NmrA family NAD(P)-binding protein [Motilimonas sp. 1_MG-2023]|uniref:NmrA family NAD(P)-binding protein n=1 Tax=Motilimonas sp. 1_MG-2023 TaxID=3062672 RepID=UPI0026E48AD5|nr:NmrA family NAD(P)-binding protein [Motilimonas sp. 1_MG-2023]MDO6526692.1 NmrA family NAD(P)-binding protein [Motilimonas sp. 1_MG-2023]